MNILKRHGRIVIKSKTRSVSDLVAELHGRVYQTSQVVSNSLEIEGTFEDSIHFFVHFTGDIKIIFTLGVFKMSNYEDIHNIINSFPWEEILASKSSFVVTAEVDEGQSFLNIESIGLMIKNRLKQCTPLAQDRLGPFLGRGSIIVSSQKNQVALALDVSDTNLEICF